MTDNNPGIDSVLKSVIGAGKSTIRHISDADLERFIESQPDVIGPVEISNRRMNAKSGASSGIVLFTAKYDRGSGPVTQELVLRHAPGTETRLFHEYDLVRQFRVQRALQGTGIPVPDALWLDADGRYLGVPGYVMHTVNGEAPSASAFSQGPLVRASEAQRHEMIVAVLRTLAKIHNVDYSARGLDDFILDGEGDNPVVRCVNWHWKTWQWINLPEFSRLEPVHRWLVQNAPRGGTTLTHGDAVLHNYLFQGHELVAVLDWELSSLCRPEADVALQCLANELFAPPADSGLPKPPSDAEWVALYERCGGKPIEHFAYFKKYAAYVVTIGLMGLQRNLSTEQRAAHSTFSNRLWSLLT